MTKAYLEPDEVERLEQAAEYLRDRLLIRLLFHLGCRVSEALGIKAGDIDFKQGLVTIQHLKQRIRLSCPECGARLGKGHKFCPVCGRKVEKAVANEKEHRKFRVLPLDEGTLKMLKEYIGRGGANTRTKLIFDLSRHRAWQIVKECAGKARLPLLVNAESGKVHNVSPHRLRDAFAVMAVKQNDSGDGIRLLQEHLGHQSITTTMRYRKVSGEEQKEWYQKLWNGGK
ncbi:integrase [Dehalococcoides mccartyi]|uniref:tyrosine-type recombinase/integrase n=1 Tax=Dehalococcoides mccartyi TaxID=61435 RepID=UPI00098FA00D|nr:tyrosine-type recombinase/integrase [Dehalococcoides mccartyi]AQU05314.1 integrase [Dehalococcoides mccartyi]AQU06767.1 integrase [Dehalococcoides mccartyi]